MSLGVGFNLGFRHRACLVCAGTDGGGGVRGGCRLWGDCTAGRGVLQNAVLQLPLQKVVRLLFAGSAPASEAKRHQPFRAFFRLRDLEL